jgi:hypothetical protein
MGARTHGAGRWMRNAHVMTSARMSEGREHAYGRRLAVVGAGLAVLAAAAAGATARTHMGAALRLERARLVGERQRVELDTRFSGGGVPRGILVTDDANPFDGRARITLQGARISTAVSSVRGAGVRVSVRVAGGRLSFTLTGARHAFTYAGYRESSPVRPVLVLWRSTPPAARAHPRFGPAGCLTLRATVAGSTIRASGRESGLFEHSFLVRLRARDGSLVAQRVMTAVGHWSVTMPFAPGAGRVATVEAYAASAKDGSLACLAQQRIQRP